MKNSEVLFAEDLTEFIDNVSELEVLPQAGLALLDNVDAVELCFKGCILDVSGEEWTSRLYSASPRYKYNEAYDVKDLKMPDRPSRR